jgi:hypothetical protein
MVDKILHLTLHKKWFKQILKGEKKIEYREIKPYWTKRLFDFKNNLIDYDYIIFKNGYNKNSPMMKVEFLGIRKKEQYEILLGKILEKNNLEKLG